MQKVARSLITGLVGIVYVWPFYKGLLQVRKVQNKRWWNSLTEEQKDEYRASSLAVFLILRHFIKSIGEGLDNGNMPEGKV